MRQSLWHELCFADAYSDALCDDAGVAPVEILQHFGVRSADHEVLPLAPALLPVARRHN